jgi:hypothetical protein
MIVAAETFITEDKDLDPLRDGSGLRSTASMCVVNPVTSRRAFRVPEPREAPTSPIARRPY